MTTLGRRIVERCTADRGRDTYSQPLRDQPGYSDCSSYAARAYRETALIDIGSYTTAISTAITGRTITTNPDTLRSGAGLQDGDIVLWGWTTDHRPGYPYSHVGIYDAIKRGTWDQYGDLAPHNGPAFHPVAQWLAKADRIMVRRYIADEPTTPLATIIPTPTPAPAKQLVVDGALGRQTITRWQQIMGTVPDGVISARSMLTMAVQTHINAAGCRDQDGQALAVDGKGIGPNVGARYPATGTTRTITALQRYLAVTVDGYLTADKSATIRALQTRLNEGRF